ncbi:MAG: hypothetical protein IPM96_21395 [Ignavibacteria bacterium]|nr:hypothetical protein [Ignavibacteria bacterium]
MFKFISANLVRDLFFRLELFLSSIERLVDGATPTAEVEFFLNFFSKITRVFIPVGTVLKFYRAVVAPTAAILFKYFRSTFLFFRLELFLSSIERLVDGATPTAAKRLNLFLNSFEQNISDHS